MSHLRRAWLVLALLSVAPPLSFGDEFPESILIAESSASPLLSPASAQTSGPLEGERLDESWDANRLSQEISPLTEPEDLFDVGEDCTENPSGVVAAPRRAFIDSTLTGTWLTPVGGFGVTDVEAKTQLVIPIFAKGSPLRLSMAYGSSFFDAPATLDIPSQLNGIQAEFRWLIPFRETMAADLAIGGGIFADDSSWSRGGRVTGRAILVKTVSEQLKWSVGILYLGRANLLATPVAGLIYTPEDDVKIELLIPRPRIGRRIAYDGTREHWMYFGMELFGGNSWAIEQPGGAEDVFIYKDSRFIFGYETKAPGALGARLEAGYVYGRQVEFENSPTTYDPSGTMLLRAGFTY